MGVVKLVELINESLVVKPVFFNLKNFFSLNQDPILEYYSFNDVQSSLGEYFKFFLCSYDKNIEVKLKGKKLQMDSLSYRSLVFENIFENLNKFYGNHFKDLEELEKVSTLYEFEYDNIFSIKGFNSKSYSRIEKDIFDELNLCKQYNESMFFVEKNLLNSKISSKYFFEVEETVSWLKEESRNIQDLKSCNSYLLKLYGLKEFIPKLVGNLF
jgi:hypothetical protein